MKKFEDKEYIKYYNPNPHNRKTNDCVIRALTLILEKDYYEVYDDLYKISIKTGFMINDKTCYEKYLKEKRFEKQPQLKKYDNSKYTGKEFTLYIKQHHNNEKIFANIGGHHCIGIKNNCIYDIWDSSQGCIGNYWIRKK